MRGNSELRSGVLFLGVDGGGTRCRARLADVEGTALGEGEAGPANIRLGLDASFAAVLDCARQSFAAAGLPHDNSRVVACLALAGASEPVDLDAAQRWTHPFRRALVTTDAQAACIGAHSGEDGGILIVGTGSVGWGLAGGVEHRVGGWGFPLSDEGSGAWLGHELARRVLWAHDGRTGWTALLGEAFARFQSDPHVMVRWMSTARPRDFGALAPLVVAHAARGDAVAVELMRTAAAHIDVLASRLLSLGVPRLAMAGGLAPAIEPWLAPQTRARLVAPKGDALAGALTLARREARAAAIAA